MKKFCTFSIGLLVIGFFSFSCEDKSEWTELLDQDLSQWDVYLSFQHKDNFNGQPPINDDSTLVVPLGFNPDGQSVFEMIEENGEPILHVTGQYYGCVITKETYENYHLTLKYKWGEKKWTPRLDKLRDCGLLYHSIGKPGVDYWRSWMLSQEFQIMEGHTGDYWSIANSAIDIRAFIPEGDMNTIAGNSQAFVPVGAGTGKMGFCLRTQNNESPKDEWTTIELICFEGKSLHIVNGVVVMVLQNSRYLENSQSIPLTKGKIQLQSEAGEVYYKDVKIRPLSTLAPEHLSFFQ